MTFVSLSIRITKMAFDLRIDSEDGFDAIDHAAYDAATQDKELWGKPSARPCVECGEESDCYASCDDGDLCERCCELDAQFADGDRDEYEDNMTDAEADADTLRSAGYGTDEDYGYYVEGDDY